ncbi:MAG: aldo/keto reductase [Acidobacteriota bacterium]
MTVNPSPQESRRPLGRTGLSCHPLGFGCYRIAEGIADHEAALRLYLEKGGNLIDTSSNYTDGSSETLVGTTIKDISPKDVIMVTKAGYIQGQNMTLAQSRSFPEVVHYGEGLWHCIHPDFLETQITRSSQRLGIECLDVFLLHNPEYFLSHRSHQGKVTPADHDEFYRRIAGAFSFLESQVSAGRIRWYGISSNHFGMPLSDPTMTSVSRCLEQALSVSSNHHFAVVQLPVNLFEPGGALHVNNEGLTCLEFCEQHGLGVLANRPLNSFHRNQLIRLADFTVAGAEPPGIEELVKLLSPLETAEKALAVHCDGTLMHGNTGLAEHLQHIVPQVPSPDHWDAVFQRYILPPLQSWIAQVQGSIAAPDVRKQALDQFFRTLSSTFEEVERFLRSKQQVVSDQVRQSLLQAGYPKTDSTLSQMAVNVLLRLKGMSCVLIGMRRPTYVQDAFGSLALGPVASHAILRRLAQ